MLKELINMYKELFKQCPLFKVFITLVIIKAFVFSVSVWEIPYTRQLNNILGLVVIIIVCAFMVFKIRKK